MWVFWSYTSNELTRSLIHVSFDIQFIWRLTQQKHVSRLINTGLNCSLEIEDVHILQQKSSIWIFEDKYKTADIIQSRLKHCSSVKIIVVRTIVLSIKNVDASTTLIYFFSDWKNRYSSVNDRRFVSEKDWSPNFVVHLTNEIYCLLSWKSFSKNKVFHHERRI